MPAIKSFTAKDVCAALGGISRSRLHMWAQLPPFCDRPTRERSARRFTKADLITFAALQTLEDTLGMKRRDVQRVSAAVHRYVSAPRQAPGAELIFIPQENLDEGEAVYLLRGQNPTGLGWVVDMSKERERIDWYLGLECSQRELPLITNIASGQQR
ncbi:hypothetical protein Q672_14965 [Marinobacter sp. EVN1]|nr:hypothetical protein Q672_14965 [Marinobacter sp. EVN1]